MIDFINKDLTLMISKTSTNTPNLFFKREATTMDIYCDNYETLDVVGSLDMIRYCERKIYNIKVKNDLSNVIALYNFNNTLCKIGILDDDIYIPIYRKYDMDDINNEIVTLILQCSKYFTDNLITETKGEIINSIALEYFEDYMVGYLNIIYGTEKESSKLIIENKNPKIITNYSTKIALSDYIRDKFITFLFSINKDYLTNSYELFTLIMDKLDFIIKNTDWQLKLNTSNDFIVYEKIIYS